MSYYVINLHYYFSNCAGDYNMGKIRYLALFRIQNGPQMVRMTNEQ